MKNYRGVVLSGGGARGSYGAGVLAAIHAADKEKGSQINNIFIGSSIGALNATLAAQGDIGKLIELWKSLKVYDVLGEDESKIKPFKLVCRAFRKPFYYFKNERIIKIIKDKVDFNKLQNSNLMITATNLVTGNLETYYISDLIDDFIDNEKEMPIEGRRFKNYRKIESEDSLVLALLASCSIPFFLPPVRIEDRLYVDGGVGNNTPTQQAAIFARFLNATGKGNCNLVICNLLDSERFVLAENYELDLGGIVHRTFDIFQHIITGEKLIAWHQINKTVDKYDKFRSDLTDIIKNDETIPDKSKENLLDKLNEFQLTTSKTPRQIIDIIDIRPSQDLYIANTLDFNPSDAEARINDGYIDTLRVFRAKEIISDGELRKLANIVGYGV